MKGRYASRALLLMALVMLLGAARAEIMDYANSANWVYRGKGVGKVADVFLLASSVSSGADGSLNIDPSLPSVRQEFLSVVNMQKGLYEDCCTLYAPYYRQATTRVYYYLSGEDAQPCLKIAYSDVKRAFEAYLREEPERPLIIAGFSQGADMGLRLLRDFFDDERLRSRLVAAYLIGWRVTDEDLAEAPWLKMAVGESDTGVVVSFNTEAEWVTDSVMVPDGVYAYAINPLNWRADCRKASASLNKGSCFLSGRGSVVYEVKGGVGAHIDPDRGTLKVSGSALGGLSVRNAGVYHSYDFQLFYRNLQQNVRTRLSRYQALNGIEEMTWEEVRARLHHTLSDPVPMETPKPTQKPAPKRTEDPADMREVVTLPPQPEPEPTMAPEPE